MHNSRQRMLLLAMCYAATSLKSLYTPLISSIARSLLAIATKKLLGVILDKGVCVLQAAASVPDLHLKVSKIQSHPLQLAKLLDPQLAINLQDSLASVSVAVNVSAVTAGIACTATPVCCSACV